MKRLPYTLKNLLAIWQQTEYDTRLFRAWIEAEPRSNDITRHIQGLTPETWTIKLRLIYRLSQILVLFLPKYWAIVGATQCFFPLESVSKWWVMWRAKRALRRYQKNGLKVIGIAGSYGKTSLKRSVYHVLSTQMFTVMTPASYNTPLGIARTILHDIRDDHECFLVELGEYQLGDIADLLEFVRPDVGIISPIGFAHLERFKNEATLRQAFEEMFNSPYAPATILSDDTNRDHFQNTEITWYGTTAKSAIQLRKFSPDLENSTWEIACAGTSTSGKTHLLGSHQVENALPGIWLLHSWGYTWEQAAQSLSYHPPTPRRLEAHHNPNKTWVIDNSYNSNPGSWKQIQKLISQLKLENILIITAGFVELDAETQTSAHAELAKNIQSLSTVVGIIPTRFNQDLRDALHTSTSLTVLEGLTREEILQQIPHVSPRPNVIWFEGGVREMYQ